MRNPHQDRGLKRLRACGLVSAGVISFIACMVGFIYIATIPAVRSRNSANNRGTSSSSSTVSTTVPPTRSTTTTPAPTTTTTTAIPVTTTTEETTTTATTTTTTEVPTTTTTAEITTTTTTAPTTTTTGSTTSPAPTFDSCQSCSTAAVASACLAEKQSCDGNVYNCPVLCYGTFIQDGLVPGTCVTLQLIAQWPPLQDCLCNATRGGCASYCTGNCEAITTVPPVTTPTPPPNTATTTTTTSATSITSEESTIITTTAAPSTTITTEIATTTAVTTATTTPTPTTTTPFTFTFPYKMQTDTVPHNTPPPTYTSCTACVEAASASSCLPQKQSCNTNVYNCPVLCYGTFVQNAPVPPTCVTLQLIAQWPPLQDCLCGACASYCGANCGATISK